ncbi:SMC-Scp complex subunit ScpB [Methylopila sp. Yamaguchi]|uniref:SMC-Scp complex subunit ScpB n=1 Tax=Methylopila sp. Yamaguchi TaxID=1437817 RepID=UPI000CA79D3F|nr:SMC-Scp complex subunit ScpB [Methylopila sp. Yamaguchi]GBD47951.1 chromosome segregation and condensation protein ScpB [Methylopila sp. Yamaguchi]
MTERDPNSRFAPRGANEPPLPLEGFGGTLSPDDVARAPELHLRILEAVLFAARAPVEETALAARLPEGADVRAALRVLAHRYASRGVNLRRVDRAWAFRTAPDVAASLSEAIVEPKKLSRAAIETLAIIAYHQPTTRAEIEEIRGVATSKGTLDALLEAGFVRLRGRRRSPGRPVTFGTTPGFLDHFGLEQVSDLPGLDELKAAGLLDARLPPGLAMPQPSDDPGLAPDEEPLGADDPFAALEIGDGEE